MWNYTRDFVDHVKCCFKLDLIYTDKYVQQNYVTSSGVASPTI